MKKLITTTYLMLIFIQLNIAQTVNNCLAPTSSTYLEINNVRALIHSGGDMWWDLQGSAKYEIPKGSGKTSLFAGSLWIGGIDQNSQLRLAAQRFRQDGIDYWTGPLKTTDASTNIEACSYFDRAYTVTREEVEEFRYWYNLTPQEQQSQFPNYSIPNSIMEWPAHGDVANGYSFFLAPFYDYNADNLYNPLDGDYPNFDLDNSQDCQLRTNIDILFGDVAIWYVFNDNGNIHTETGGEALGFEFQAHAFAFISNDNDVNNATFYNYNIINRSSNTIHDTYVGIFTDADLGDATDDFVGCDVIRGLGYAYNGDDTDGDGQTQAYGTLPPAVGIDFFRGPYKDYDGEDNLSSRDNDGNLDCNNGYRYNDITEEMELIGSGDILNGNINGLNFGDGIIDNERLGMNKFIYFNNTGMGAPASTTDPHTASEHYNLLIGKWKTGDPLYYGGNGYNTQWPENLLTNYMFPSNSDVCGVGQEGIVMNTWDEYSEYNTPDDRRFIQSSGPFTMEPGVINNITTGVVWARQETQTANWHSINELKNADDKIQNIFDHCFQVFDVIDAPDLSFSVIDQHVNFTLWNKETSNNYNESYSEINNYISCPTSNSNCDKVYNFQGYQVYQLSDSNVTLNDLDNSTKARLVYQCDVQDNIQQIINYYWSSELSTYISKVMAMGANFGINHNFSIYNDVFNNTQLESHQTYYYMAVSYAYNNFKTFNIYDQSTWDGQKEPYLRSINNTKVYSVKLVPENISSNPIYESSPEITQYDGYGCGYNILDLKQETIDQIMSGEPWRADSLQYKAGYGPVSIKIIDPLNYSQGKYLLKLIPEEMKLEEGYFYSNSYYQPDSTPYDPMGYIYDSKWMIIDIYNTNENFDTIISTNWISESSLEVIPELGIAIEFNQTPYPLAPQYWTPKQPATTTELPLNNGFISASIEFENPNTPWLNFISDNDFHEFDDWIKAGSENYDNSSNTCARYYNDRNIVNPLYSVIDGLTPMDPSENFENVLNGTWAPFRLGSTYLNGVSESTSLSTIYSKERRLSNVDIVVTNDKTKWTRCPVIETTDNDIVIDSYGCETMSTSVNSNSIGNTLKFRIRSSASIDKNGNAWTGAADEISANPDDANYIYGTGMGWFPGYAIDVETGHRLNMMYGEASGLSLENGSDMLWNPSSNIGENDSVLMGGKHFIYILGQNEYLKSNVLTTGMPTYDAGDTARYLLTKAPSSLYIKETYKNAMWLSIPIQNPAYNFLECDVTIKLRVVAPYKKRMGSIANYPDNTAPNQNYPMYIFNTSQLDVIVSDNRPDKKSNNNELIVYPNPSSGNFTIKLDKLESKDANYEIYSVEGKLIQSDKLQNNFTSVTLNNKGIYFIRVINGDKILTKKILVK